MGMQIVKALVVHGLSRSTIRLNAKVTAVFTYKYDPPKAKLGSELAFSRPVDVYLDTDTYIELINMAHHTASLSIDRLKDRCSPA